MIASNCQKPVWMGGIHIAAALLLSAIGTMTTAAAQEMPAIILGSQPYPGEASIFVAEAKGFFDQAGVRVTDRRLPSGRLTLDAMLSGSLDIATPVETGPMFSIANGTEMAIIAQASTNPEEVKPVVRIASGVKGAKDLKGKRLGYGAGSSNQFAMYNWLNAGGVDASEVKLVNLQPADLVTALVSGELDVAFTWEPFLTQAVKKGGGQTVLIEGQGLYQSRLLLTAKPDWAKNNTDTIARLLSGLKMAANWMKQNRTEAVRITAAAIGMDATDLDPIFDRWQFDLELPKGLIEAFNAQFEWASRAKLLQAGTSKPDYTKYFYPDALKRVNPQGITY